MSSEEDILHEEKKEETQVVTEKISFKEFNSDKRSVSSIPLNPITIVGTFQSLNQEDEIKRNRLDRIELYYTDLQEIVNSKVGGISKKYNVSAIEGIYVLIFGKKGKNKNDNIDEIVKYYRTYVPRLNNNKGNTIINTNGNNSKFSHIDIPLFGKNSTDGIDGVKLNDDRDSDDSEVEF